MYTRLFIEDAWERLKQLSRNKNRGKLLAAVPFIDAGASLRMRFVKGDTIVLRFDEAAVRAGLVDPKEITNFLLKGVEVFSVRNLHAKVFVIGKTAIVGSMNISANSESQLIEAICESNEPSFVKSCSDFIKGLRSDEITPDFSKRLESLYKSKRTSGTKVGKQPRKRRVTSDLAMVRLDDVFFDSQDEDIERAGKVNARKMLKDTQKYVVECFRWQGIIPNYFKPGIRLVLNMRSTGNSRIVSSPARILHIRKYRTKNGNIRNMVFLERRKSSEDISLAQLTKLIPSAASLKNKSGKITDAQLAFDLGRLWARSSS